MKGFYKVQHKIEMGIEKMYFGFDNLASDLEEIAK